MIIHFCHPSRAPRGVPMLHIQARPQSWVIAMAPRSIPLLTPQAAEVAMMQRCVSGRKAGEDITAIAAEYRRLYVSRVAASPARFPDIMQDDQQSPITGEVSCVCTCSIAEAAARRCHRAWAADLLATVDGWEVYLDGDLCSGDPNRDYWAMRSGQARQAGDTIHAEAFARMADAGTARP